MASEAKTFCVLVKVESGIPVSVEAFHEKKKAEQREKHLRKRMHPDNDETGLFEIEL